MVECVYWLSAYTGEVSGSSGKNGVRTSHSGRRHLPTDGMT